MEAIKSTERVMDKCVALATEEHFIERSTFGFTCQCGFHTGFGGDALRHMEALA